MARTRETERNRTAPRLSPPNMGIPPEMRANVDVSYGRDRQYDGRVMSDATEDHDGAPQVLPTYYVVLRGGRIQLNGSTIEMKAERIIADSQYDVRYLQRCGIKLKNVGQHAPHLAPQSVEEAEAILEQRKQDEAGAKSEEQNES